MSGPGGTITLTNGNDSWPVGGIDFNTGNETVFALGGIDAVDGGIGNDVIFGGLDPDTIIGGEGSDELHGDEGNDVITDAAGLAVNIFGGDGDDDVYIGNTFLAGTVDGGPGLFDRLYDVSFSGPPINLALLQISGFEELAIFEATGLASQFQGFNNIHSSNGEAPQDPVTLNLVSVGVATSLNLSASLQQPYASTIKGSLDRETIATGVGRDTIFGFGGDDVLRGQAGNDILRGGIGNDLLDGGAENDTLRGDDGNDYVLGGAGGDSLYGGNGSDRLYADAGNDFLQGDASNDNLYGGAGLDRFNFDPGNASDVIFDFVNDQDTMVIDPAFGFATAAAVLASTYQSGAHARIILGGGNQIYLWNYLAAGSGNTIGNLIDDIVIA